MLKNSRKYCVVAIVLIVILVILSFILIGLYPTPKKQISIGKIDVKGNQLNYYSKNAIGEHVLHIYNPKTNEISTSDSQWEKCFYQSQDGEIYQDKTGVYWLESSSKKSIPILTFHIDRKNVYENVSSIATSEKLWTFLYVYKEQQTQKTKNIIYCFDIDKQELSVKLQKDTFIVEPVKVGENLLYHDNEKVIVVLPDGTEHTIYSAPDSSNIRQMFAIKEVIYILQVEVSGSTFQDKMLRISPNGEIQQEYTLSPKVSDTVASLVYSQNNFYYGVRGVLYSFPIDGSTAVKKVADIPSCKIKSPQYSVFPDVDNNIYIVQTATITSGYQGYCIDLVSANQEVIRVEENTWYGWMNRNAK